MTLGLHTLLKTCAGAMVCGLLSFFVALMLVQQPAFAANNYDQKLDVISSQKRADVGIPRMQANGLLDAIKKYGGSHEKELQAIAIRESDGRLSIKNPGSQAYCAFQIGHEKIIDFSAERKMTYNDYREKLMTSADFCAEAGAKALDWHLSKQGAKRGFCGYGGPKELEIFDRTGSCPMLVHIRVLMAAIDGTLTFDTKKDIDSPDFSKVVVRDGSGVIATALNCHDYADDFARGLAKAQQSYLTTSYTAADEMAAVQMASENANPMRNQRGSILETYCLGMELDYMNALRKLVRGVKFIEILLEGFANELMNLACEYALAFVQNAVLSVLDDLCIPLPDINLRLDLKGLKRTSCGAGSVSMGDVLTTSFGIDPKQLFKEDSIPPVNGLPTSYGGGSSGTFNDMRRK